MRYSKALERRGKCLRKLAAKSDDLSDKVAKLTQCMDDITSVCILEGFQKQEHMMLVDAILKELGKAEAAKAVKNRVPSLSSKHFIQQYFLSFANDPIMEEAKKMARENGGSSNGNGDESSTNGADGVSNGGRKER